jgi:hypothetical protein
LVERGIRQRGRSGIVQSGFAGSPVMPFSCRSEGSLGPSWGRHVAVRQWSTSVMDGHSRSGFSLFRPGCRAGGPGSIALDTNRSI